MSQNDVEKIKERLGIEEVVGTYLKLEKAGKNLKARCPFHNEKTPSFVVSPDRGTYYCFGCDAKGDIFTFVQEFEGLDFSGSLKVLADRAGISLTPFSGGKDKQADRLRKIMNLAVQFYQVHLSRNPEAIKYLTDRGLKPETIKEWQIGFAPNDWEKLLSFLKTKQCQDAELEATGLIKKGDRGKYYDRFRSRIMFPIFDASGRAIAFSGRIFNGKDDDAKYINSPETPLFDKSRTLYGFDHAKKNIRKNDFSILVEGQMDLIMSHQSGYGNTVASSGTALTRDQLEKISRISEKIVIAYDSDGAGFRASEKAWQMALALGMDVKIAPIPQGSDPADILKNDVQGWKEIIKNSRHIIEIFIQKIKEEAGDHRELGKRVSKDLVPYLASVASNIDQAHFIDRVHEELEIPADSIRQEVKNFTDSNQEMNVAYQPEDSGLMGMAAKDDLLTTEKQLLGIIFWQESEKEKVLDTKAVEDKVRSILKDSYQSILDKITDDKEGLIFKMETLYQDEKQKGYLEKEVDELLVNLKIKYLSKEIERIKQKLKKEDLSEEDSVKSKRYQEEILKISKEIDSLKER